ncbi:MAG TPA: hypothetical protein VGD08_12745 [Stellaceae bacterium]|jgi:hypothetical protein
MPFDGSNPVDGVAAKAPGAGEAMRDATTISLPPPPPAMEHLPGAAAWKDRLLALLRRVDAYLFPPVPNEPADVTPAQVLEEARGLVEERQDWAQGAYVTFGGRYCAIGAVRTAGRCLGDRAAERAACDLLADAVARRGFPDVETMNDRSSHRAVLAAFDEAIAAAQRAEGEGGEPSRA